MEKKRLRTITILISKKIVIHKQRIKTKLTKKRKTNEKKKNERKKKKKCNKDILSMYKKVYSFNIKYHVFMMFFL